MFGVYKLKTRVENELNEKHGDKFAYLEKVINSCETTAQLLNATFWARNYLIDMGRLESKKRSSAEAVIAEDYFDFRKEIIMTVYSRKDKEIYEKEEE